MKPNGSLRKEVLHLWRIDIVGLDSLLNAVFGQQFPI